MSSINQYKANESLISYSLLSIMLIFTGLAFFMGIDGLMGLVFLGLILGLLYSTFLLKNGKLWIYSLIAISPVYFYGSKPGISPNDVFMAIYMTSFLVLWFIYIIFFKKDKIVHSLSDWLILLFYIISLLGVIISLSNNIDFMEWAKEYAIYSVCLLYFPIKYYIKEKEEIKLLLLIFAVSIFISDFYHYYLYKTTALRDVFYAYQLGISVRLNQTLFTVSAFMGMVFAIYETNIFKKIALLVFSIATTVSLIITFSRTFWIILAALIFLAFLIMPFKKKRQMALIAFIISTAFISLSLIVFKDNAEIFLKVAEQRLTSAGKGTQDASVKARFREYEQVYKDILENPLGGNGIGAKIRIFDYFKLTTSYLANVHNAYLMLAHRYGIPLSLIFLTFIAINLYYSFLGIFKLKDTFYKTLSYGAAASLLTLIISGFTSAQFFVRDGQFVLAFSFFFVYHLKNQLILEKNESRKIQELLPS